MHATILFFSPGLTKGPVKTSLVYSKRLGIVARIRHGHPRPAKTMELAVKRLIYSHDTSRVAETGDVDVGTRSRKVRREPELD